MLLLCLMLACRPEQHHLIENVIERVEHQRDTTGYGHWLDAMHGIWIERKYSDALRKTRSITQANRLFPSGLTVFNIDTRQFRSDSLPFVALNTNDFQAIKGCFYFYKNKNGQADIDVAIYDASQLLADIDISIGFERMEFDTFMTIEQDFGANLSEMAIKDRYARVSYDVSDKVYQYDPLIGVEIYTRQFWAGTYDVYDANNNVLMQSIVLNSDGTISQHPFAKYHLLAWDGFDALMIHGLALLEEQPKPNYQYYAIRQAGSSIHLHNIIPRKKGDQVGQLQLRMRKRQ